MSNFKLTYRLQKQLQWSDGLGATMQKIILTAIMAIAVSGCVTSEQKAQIYGSQVTAGPAVRASAVDYVRKTFFDPYSIRDAEISNVVTLLETGVQAVCIRMNAKNRMGAYTGLKATSLRLKNGSVISGVTDAPGCYAAELRYSKFNELENL